MGCLTLNVSHLVVRGEFIEGMRSVHVNPWSAGLTSWCEVSSLRAGAGPAATAVG